MRITQRVRQVAFGAVVAFTITPLLFAASHAMIVATREMTSGSLLEPLTLALAKGAVFGSPFASCVAVIVADWCAANVRGYSRRYLTFVSAFFCAAAGATYGHVLEVSGSAQGFSGLLPVGGLVGAIVGALVALAVTRPGQCGVLPRDKLATRSSRRAPRAAERKR